MAQSLREPRLPTGGFVFRQAQDERLLSWSGRSGSRRPFASPLITLLVSLALALVLLACEELEDGSPRRRTRTPTATPAVAATGTATGPIGTPTEVGLRAELTPNAAVEADGVRVILLQVIDPWDQPPVAETPEAGYRYVEVAVTLENRSSDEVVTGFGAFQFVSDDGTSRPARKVDGAEPYLDLQAIAADAAIQGFVIGEVKDGSDLAGIIFEPDSGTPDQAVFGEQ